MGVYLYQETSGNCGLSCKSYLSTEQMSPMHRITMVMTAHTYMAFAMCQAQS